MSFRNIKNSVPTEQDCTSFVALHDDKFADVNINVSLPSSNEYCLADLLASGQRVVPVDTSILHDTAATSQLVDSIMNPPEPTE